MAKKSAKRRFEEAVDAMRIDGLEEDLLGFSAKPPFRSPLTGNVVSKEAFLQEASEIIGKKVRDPVAAAQGVAAKFREVQFAAADARMKAPKPERGLARVVDYDPLEEGRAAGARRKRVENMARGTRSGPGASAVKVGAGATPLALPEGASTRGAVTKAVTKGLGRAGGLVSRVALPLAAAYTAYQVGSEFLDRTEGRDQRQRLRSAIGEAGLLDDMGDGIEELVLRNESKAAKGLMDTERASESLEGRRQSLLARELGAVMYDRAEEIGKIQAVSGPSPLEIEARMRSLLG